MEAKRLKLSINSMKSEIELPPRVETLNDLCAFIKEQEKLKVKDLDVFIKVSENEPVLLSQANFNDLIRYSNKQEISLLVLENVECTEELEHLSNEMQEDAEERGEQRLASSREENFFQGKCVCCNTSITRVKYVCCICDNEANYCSKCEPYHKHPMIKYKNVTLTQNFNDLLKFINNFNKVKEVSSFSFFHKDVEIFTDVKKPWPIKPGKTVSFPIKVKWNNNVKEIYELIIKNNKDLEVDYEMKHRETRGKEEVSDLFLSLTAPHRENNSDMNQQGYSIVVLFYSLIAEKMSNTIEFKLEVNEWEYDGCEDLNLFFKNYPEIYCLPRKEKEMIRTVFTDRISNKKLSEIHAILKKNKFNLQQAITDLTK